MRCALADAATEVDAGFVDRVALLALNLIGPRAPDEWRVTWSRVNSRITPQRLRARTRASANDSPSTSSSRKHSQVRHAVCVHSLSVIAGQNACLAFKSRHGQS